MPDEPKFTIPPENFTSFVVSVLGDISAKLLVLTEVTKQIYCHKFEKTEPEVREYFDQLLLQSKIETLALHFSKFGGSSKQ
jgi:hypothetical protein